LPAPFGGATTCSWGVASSSASINAPLTCFIVTKLPYLSMKHARISVWDNGFYISH
jgi:hypothetical protein